MIDNLHFLLKGTAYLLDEREKVIFEPFNLSAHRFHLLNHLLLTPGIAPSDLSEKMLVHRSSVTRMVRGLEKEGLLIRQHDQIDYRSIHLSLTEKGEALIKAARKSFETHIRDRKGILPPEKRQKLIDHLRGLYDLLDQ